MEGIINSKVNSAQTTPFGKIDVLEAVKDAHADLWKVSVLNFLRIDEMLNNLPFKKIGEMVEDASCHPSEFRPPEKKRAEFKGAVVCTYTIQTESSK